MAKRVQVVTAEQKETATSAESRKEVRSIAQARALYELIDGIPDNCQQAREYVSSRVTSFWTDGFSG
ncbi:hypothetical protein NSS79_10990 [Paenibacillus sp. FSL L8-0436]|uniref:hypothetical protein n=1 Tax=Paenibacillus sp. FSL L8-0436 TaxID=2954686 RepID=UPI0031584AA3